MRIKLPPWSYRAVSLTQDHSDTLVAWFSYILLCPRFSSVLVLSSISPPSQIIFQNTLKPFEHQRVQSKAYFSFLFFKDCPGQQALAQVGMHWHMLAHIGKRVVPTQWLPSHRGLPKKLQMTVLSFSAPILLSPPLYFTLLLPLSFSSSLCLVFFPLAVFISCSEAVNLMKRKVKHLAGIRKHPCDNYVCVSCVRVSTERRFIL